MRLSVLYPLIVSGLSLIYHKLEVRRLFLLHSTEAFSFIQLMLCLADNTLFLFKLCLTIKALPFYLTLTALYRLNLLHKKLFLLNKLGKLTLCILGWLKERGKLCFAVIKDSFQLFNARHWFVGFFPFVAHAIQPFLQHPLIGYLLVYLLRLADG